MRFFAAARAFLNMATLTKHRILHIESYFVIFRVFVFFVKKHRKFDPKIQRAFFIPKITENWSLGANLGPQMVPNSRPRGQKWQKSSELRNLRRILRETSSGRGPPREKLREMPPQRDFIFERPRSNFL